MKRYPNYSHSRERSNVDASQDTPFWVRMLLLGAGIVLMVLMWVLAEWFLSVLLCNPDGAVACVESDGFGRFVIQAGIVGLGVVGLIIGLLLPFHISVYWKILAGLLLGGLLMYGFLSTHNVNVHGCPKTASSVPVGCPTDGTFVPKEKIRNPWKTPPPKKAKASNSPQSDKS